MTHSSSAQHEGYMTRCLELARRAVASGDSPVGALVVREGEILGEGCEAVQAKGDITAHAEIVALRAASQRLATLDLTGCTLYTSVDPCVMCAFAIRLARVSVVVSGARSSDADRPLSGWQVLTDADALPSRPVPAVIRDVLSRDGQV